MPYNIPLFAKIHAEVTARPENHYQGNWETVEDPFCGTTRCIGGWAIHLSKKPGESFYEAVERIGDEAERLGTISNAAEILLGLERPEANTLFFELNDEESVRFIEEILGAELAKEYT